MDKLFSLQPASCRLPYVFPNPGNLADYTTPWGKQLRETYNRLNGYDPSPIFQRAAHILDPMKRTQLGLSVADLFPNSRSPTDDIFCACGCGVKIQPRRRYATEACAQFVNVAFEIIYGKTERIGNILAWADGDDHRCAELSDSCAGFLEVDHIVGVKHGGGASWLSNFRILCRHHHVDKTNRDFKRGKYSDRNPILFEPDKL